MSRIMLGIVGVALVHLLLLPNYCAASDWTVSQAPAGLLPRRYCPMAAIRTETVMVSGGEVCYDGWSNWICNLRNDVWYSKDGGATWAEPVNATWAARSGHQMVALAGHAVLVIGGQTNGDMMSPSTFFTDVWLGAFDPSGSEVAWVLRNSSVACAARSFAASVLLPDNSVLLMGGRKVGYTVLSNDVWRTTDEGVSWVAQSGTAGAINPCVRARARARVCVCVCVCVCVSACLLRRLIWCVASHAILIAALLVCVCSLRLVCCVFACLPG